MGAPDRTTRLLREAARGLVGGAAGTGAMALAAKLRREAYARRHGIAVSEIEEILDYDDSEHVVIAASRLMHAVIGWAPRTERGRGVLFWVVHWGYGSVVGATHVALQRALGREPLPGLVFFTGSQLMALGLFPVLGDTPPPWRWRPPLLRTSFVQHGIYAGVVAAANTVTATDAVTARVTRRR